MLNSQILAANIRAARERLHLSQTDVAKMLYVTPQTVSKWENGVAVPDLANLCNLASMLSTTPDRLLGVQENCDFGKVLIGIDGGGTKTDFVLFREDGTVLRRLILGASNPNAVGMEVTLQVLKQGIDSLLAINADVGAVFAGIAGSAAGGNREKMMAFLKKQYPHMRLSVASDIQNIISSVRGATKCTAVICGTGMVVFANDGNNLTRIGGWGYLFDGAGSGYDIGRDVLQKCLEFDDGIGEDSLAVQLAKKKLGGTTYDQLDRIYSGGKDVIASFAPVVLEAYRQGDATAEAILSRNFAHIAKLICHALTHYDCGTSVILAGGLTSDPAIPRRFLSPLLPPDTELIFPTLPPVYGACVCSAALLGIQADPADFDHTFLQTLQNG